ncbi:hypothetical protein AVHM3334_01425 [Acidovorax sp. SUPP3334]|nr:hypothetical protein AVHM3334_01425 [Acidovorax sp. SUPP3334]
MADFSQAAFAKAGAISSFQDHSQEDFKDGLGSYRFHCVQGSRFRRGHVFRHQVAS